MGAVNPPSAPASAERQTSSGTPTGRAAIACIAASIAGFWLVAVAGPSVVSHELAGGGWLPPYSLDTSPAPWLVVAGLWGATLAGTAGTWLALRAINNGWRPRPRGLLAAAAVTTVAFAVVPPVNSDDVYSYAAYGQMAATGRDPYTTAPDDLAGDPVADAVTPPWREEPSVYGPLATAQQAAVMRAVGTSVRWGVMGLSALGALAFLMTAFVLDGYAGDDAGRARAALCWGLNPLLLFHLVGGAHLDVLGVLGLVGALGLYARRRVTFAGAALGSAIAIKLTGGIAAIGLAWPLRRQPKRLAALMTGGVLVVVPLYMLAGGLTALDQARTASRFVSHASWWRPIAVRLDAAVGVTSSRRITSLLALAAFLALGWLLARTLPDEGARIRCAARWAFTPTLAWLLTSTYTLPWYAAWAWPLIALIAASRWDDILLAWTAVLTLAYIPGRDVDLPAGLAGVTRWVRAGLGPLSLMVLLGAAVVLARRAGPSADGTADPSP